MSINVIMKNNECIIYLVTKHGSTQIYRKDELGWTQTSSKGIVRRMTAEQFLSHLLPALTEEYKEKVSIKVKRIKTHNKKNEKYSKNHANFRETFQL